MKAIVLTNNEGGAGIQTAVDTVVMNGSALDAVEAGIRVVEFDAKVRSVGFGGAPNILGQMECDASIMCGATLRTGAVGALKNYFHPISVARQIMERTPHVMLVGDGAEIYAAEIGEKKGDLLSEEAKADYEQWLKDHLTPEVVSKWPDIPLAPLIMPSARAGNSHGTTVFLVRNNDGNLAGGVSTSGWAYKYPGRLGDSPIIGAGLYVDNRYGAVACTHTGEMTIRAGTSRAIIAYVKKGATMEEAVHEALDDLRSLRGGTIGGVVVYAIDSGGTPYVMALGLGKGISYWFWAKTMKDVECRSASITGI